MNASTNALARKQGPRFLIRPYEQICVDETHRNYLIKGLISSTGIAVIWGPPKCGKSFWALDAALHVALGWEYRGRRVRQGLVLYLALEGAKAFEARVEAFRQHHNAANADFGLITAHLNLVAEHQALLGEIRQQVRDRKPVAVFIDTLNRSLKGSESKDEDMAAYIAAADAVATAFECVVPIVHHCGVDATRPRGHTSLTGAVECQLAIRRDAAAGQFIVTLEFCKDGPEGAELVCKLEPVNVGIDPDGDAITTCVVIEGVPAPPTARNSKLAAVPLAGLRVLNECLS